MVGFTTIQAKLFIDSTLAFFIGKFLGLGNGSMVYFHVVSGVAGGVTRER